MITFLELVDKVFACRICSKSYGFSSSAPNEPYFKFPPIIGKSHDAELLFVGINPRISDSNRRDHDFWMRDKSNFLSLSTNRVRGQSYLEKEYHYRFHVRLVKKLFGEDCNFENVAAVTEIFLCATENTSRLTDPESRCADLYFVETVRLTNPRAIVAVGARVMDYFKMQPPHEEWTWIHTGLKVDRREIPVVSIHHPADRNLSESQKDARLLEAASLISPILKRQG